MKRYCINITRVGIPRYRSRASKGKQIRIHSKINYIIVLNRTKLIRDKSVEMPIFSVFIAIVSKSAVFYVIEYSLISEISAALGRLFVPQ